MQWKWMDRRCRYATPKTTRTRRRRSRPTYGGTDRGNRGDTGTLIGGTGEGIGAETATGISIGIAAGVGSEGGIHEMTWGRIATGEGGAAAQTLAVVGKNGGEKGTAIVAVAPMVLRAIREGAGVGVEVGTKPRGQDTMTDGGAGAGPGVVTRIMGSSPDNI